MALSAEALDICRAPGGNLVQVFRVRQQNAPTTSFAQPFPERRVWKFPSLVVSRFAVNGYHSDEFGTHHFFQAFRAHRRVMTAVMTDFIENGLRQQIVNFLLL